MTYSILLHDKKGAYPLFDIGEVFPHEGIRESQCRNIRVTAAFSQKGDVMLVTLTAAAAVLLRRRTRRQDSIGRRIRRTIDRSSVLSAFK